MAIEKGDIRTSVNYEVMAKKPLDARELKPTKASLFDKESWSYDGSSIYIYDGMQVFVEDEKKTYVLVDASKFDTEEGWELLGTGASSEMEQVAVIDSLDSLLTDAALSANQGRILSERIEEVAGEATKIYSIKGSTKYAELPMTGNKVGDVYNITDTFTLGGVSYPAGTNVVWDGSNWDALGGSIDLSAYAKTEEVTTMVQTEAQRAQGAEKILQATTTNLWTAVDGKVDKVSGKGLSTEDFTSALKKKLDELVNYDDEDIRSDIESLQSQLDTLTNSDDLEDVIAKYEELKAFLEGLGNDEYGAFVEEISERIATLEANLKTTNSRIDNVAEEVQRLEADKQDALTSGVDIVTINNETILRRGNLDLATKEYVDDALAGIEGGGGGNANVLVINSDVDFNLREGLNTTGGIINDKNITYAKVKEAVDNGYTIALKEPSGNISYCIKADYAVPNQNGERRIMLFFSWRIGDEEYAASLYVGLDSSLSYAKWKLDLATKDYVDGAIEDIPSGGGGITEETEVYIGEEAPTDDGAKLWIDTDDESGETSGGNGGSTSGESGGVKLYPIYSPTLLGVESLTSEQQSDNAKAVRALMENEDCLFCTTLADSFFSEVILLNGYIKAEGMVWFKTSTAEDSSESVLYKIIDIIVAEDGSVLQENLGERNLAVSPVIYNLPRGLASGSYEFSTEEANIFRKNRTRLSEMAVRCWYQHNSQTLLLNCHIRDINETEGGATLFSTFIYSDGEESTILNITVGIADYNGKVIGTTIGLAGEIQMNII